MVYEFRLQIGNACLHRRDGAIVVLNVKEVQDFQYRPSLVENHIFVADDERMLSPFVAQGHLHEGMADSAEPVRIGLVVLRGCLETRWGA